MGVDVEFGRLGGGRPRLELLMKEPGSGAVKTVLAAAPPVERRHRAERLSPLGPTGSLPAAAIRRPARPCSPATADLTAIDAGSVYVLSEQVFRC